jgi:superfamily II DNA or RNA helicase
MDSKDDCLRPGDSVRLRGDPSRQGTLAEVVERAGQRYGRVRFPTSLQLVPLDQLEPLPASPEEPVELLRRGRFVAPETLRRVLSQIRFGGRLADMLYSMGATRADFYPHQYKPVLKLLDSPTGNVLIADEVGLGKTIEAALIWTELRARFDYRRLLVLCPKSLCLKWQAELESKFGIDARIHGAEELLSLLSDRERWTRGFAAICSLQSVRPPRDWDAGEGRGNDSARARLARLLDDRAEDEPLFDVCVVDEAHHLRNSETLSHELARLLRQVTSHMVFLSATPIHLRNRDLFALLSLLDPDSYPNESALDWILEANRPLVAAREEVLRGGSKTAIAAFLDEAERSPLLAGNRQLAHLRERLASIPEPLSPDQRAELAQILERANLLANTVSRTRRRDVEELRVRRDVKAYRAPMSDAERAVYDRLTAEVCGLAWTSDVPPGFLLATTQRLLTSSIPAALDHWRRRIEDFELEDEEDGAVDPDRADTVIHPVGSLVRHLAEVSVELPSFVELEEQDSKFIALRGILEEFFRNEPEGKIIVFSGFRATIRYLERRLRRDGFHCAVIHGEVADRGQVLDRFRDDPELRILLSSEVGSEGIDLQFCRALVNYDLPWNPMRVEQRIGRVDRLGQEAPKITVLNLLYENTIDDKIYTRLYERLRLCERALGGFEEVLGQELSTLVPDLLNPQLTEQEREERLDQTSQAIANRLKLEAELEEDAAALVAHGDLVLRSITEKRAQGRWIGAEELATYIREVLGELYPGCHLTDRSDGLWEVALTPDVCANFHEWLRRRGQPLSARLGRDTLPVLCRLGEAKGSSPSRGRPEEVTLLHPFVRFLADRAREKGLGGHRPAVAARVQLVDVRARDAGELGPGRYLIATHLWTFSGPVEQQLVVHEGVAIGNGEAIPQRVAEALVSAVMEAGRIWPDCDAVLATGKLAELYDQKLKPLLEERFAKEVDRRQAELADRVAIQIRNLERNRDRQSDAIRQAIEKLRVRTACGDLAADKAERMISLNESKLRKLRSRFEVRRQELAKGREMIPASSALAITVVDVAQ